MRQVSPRPLVEVPVPFLRVFVSDLRHFLNVPDDAPGPARTLAEQLGFVVRAATATTAGIA